jgi:hypothetical protein
VVLGTSVVGNKNVRWESVHVEGGGGRVQTDWEVRDCKKGGENHKRLQACASV